MAQWEFVDWLLFWLLEATEFEFDWDSGNSSKSVTKHGVATDEAESVFKLRLAVPLGVQIAPKTNEQRLGVVGPGLNGRLLQIAFVIRGGRIRVISSRRAHRKERRQYEETLRKITERI